MSIRLGYYLGTAAASRLGAVPAAQSVTIARSAVFWHAGLCLPGRRRTGPGHRQCTRGPPPGGPFATVWNFRRQLLIASDVGLIGGLLAFAVAAFSSGLSVKVR